MSDEVTPIQPVRVLLTGASGFIAQALSRRLRADGYLVTALSRDSLTVMGKPCAHQGGVNEQARSLLVHQDCVVHLAARVHVMHETTNNPLDELRRVNV